ncbi:MAG: dihydrofolate reductase [Variibacter sp.]
MRRGGVCWRVKQESGRMPQDYRIEGYAIVSVEGMIADARGEFPPQLKNDADQRFFRAGLDSAAAVALGRITHDRERNLGRRRLVLTRKVASLRPDADDPQALFWNPAGATFQAARLALGLRQGSLAVIGGTEVFGTFLAIGYDAFHLSRAAKAHVPHGRPIFEGVGTDATPEDKLRAAGLRMGPPRLLDPTAGVTLTTWSR